MAEEILLKLQEPRREFWGHAPRHRGESAELPLENIRWVWHVTVLCTSSPSHHWQKHSELFYWALRYQSCGNLLTQLSILKTRGWRKTNYRNIRQWLTFAGDFFSEKLPSYRVENVVYIYISKVKLATVVEGDQKAPSSMATTPRCRGGRNSFPWVAPLYPWYVPYIAEC